MARVLLADSQPLFNEALEALFSRDDVHQVVGRCSSAEDAFTHVSSLRPELVLVDAALGLEGSPTLVARMLEACPGTAALSRSTTVDATWRSLKGRSWGSARSLAIVRPLRPDPDGPFMQPYHH